MMDKSCHSSGEEESSSTTNPNPNPNLDSITKDHYLKQIHKLSHKISKPPLRKQPFEFDNHHQHLHHHQPQLILDESQPSNLLHNQQQHQPPVYNVSKSDFRDVVQKLTGSPAHEKVQKPSAGEPVKPQSSRLQRIRPPPLEHICNRPSAVSETLFQKQHLMVSNKLGSDNNMSSDPSFRPAGGVGGNFFPRQHHHQPLSPLPPLPTVHAAAESPISAYMRCIQSNVTGFTQPPVTQLQPSSSSPAPDFPAPSSPLPFGCLPPMLSPRFPFSPTNQFGFQQLTPLSPNPPAPSPRWKSVG
ncbi:hypothetical protein QVD17_38349 [Tagetes erecta]|uniref:VQ domain-containing protein n=1 Tax=Tagetes erecta TaxID=13708 RepID=A0AAD8NG47_TARER|nr:hypothetical protein QVD17_38349 [Tagetes erecta]